MEKLCKGLYRFATIIRNDRIGHVPDLIHLRIALCEALFSPPLASL